MDTGVDANDSAPEMEHAAHETRSHPRLGVSLIPFPHRVGHMFYRDSHVIFDEPVLILFKVCQLIFFLWSLLLSEHTRLMGAGNMRL